MVKKGDYVVIQFGHNDGGIKKIKRYCTHEEFRYNLTKFIHDVQSKGAQPVLCTPIQRRKFDSVGNLVNTHGYYPEICRELAMEFDIPLVDMQEKSNKLIQSYGVEGSKALFLHIGPGQYSIFPDGKIDNTHFSVEGARLMAGLFVEGITEIKHGLLRYLKDEDKK